MGGIAVHQSSTRQLVIKQAHIDSANSVGSKRRGRQEARRKARPLDVQPRPHVLLTFSPELHNIKSVK